MFTFSVRLEKWSFHVADLLRTGKKCAEITKAAKGMQSFCLCSLNTQNLWRFRCRRVVDLKLPNESTDLLKVKCVRTLFKTSEAASIDEIKIAKFYEAENLKFILGFSLAAQYKSSHLFIYLRKISNPSHLRGLISGSQW